MLRSVSGWGLEPDNRSASLAPTAGQNRAETTANTNRATRMSSPLFSPNIHNRLTQDGVRGEELGPVRFIQVPLVLAIRLQSPRDRVWPG
jgi:hypothetical protein